MTILTIGSPPAQWWRNLCRYYSEFTTSSMPLGDHLLQDWGARLKRIDDKHGPVTHIEFDDEQLVTLFLLRWA